MTCRVVRSFQDQPRIDLSFCCACGSKKLEAFYTLKTLGPHLCRICAQYTRPHDLEMHHVAAAPHRDSDVSDNGRSAYALSTL